MLVYSRVEEKKMSYADAAKERPHAENRNTTRQKAYGKYFSESLLVTSAVGLTCDEVVQDLRKHGYFHLISGVQRLWKMDCGRN